MKRFSFLSALVLAFLFAASCTKDSPAEEQAPSVGGQHLLTGITASLGDASSKTTLVNYTTVTWNEGDKIAVKGSDNNTLYTYVLSSGAGSSIGYFKPESTAAGYSNASDLVAIYPADAASINSGTISLSLNRSSAGLDFSANDIKAAKGTGRSSDGNINFTFTQLATYCEFTLDFTGADDYSTYKDEKLYSLSFSAKSGSTSRMISGSATLNTSTLALSGYSSSSVSRSWSEEDAPSLSSAIRTEMLLFPTVAANDDITITAVTEQHTFTFTGKTLKSFEGGRSLKFPINVDVNFRTSGDLSYAVSSNLYDFTYYGGTNCLLIKPGETSGSLDVNPYFTSTEHFKNTKVPAVGKTAAQSAKVIWREGDLNISSLTISGGKLTVTLGSAAGYGNALVGIYSGTNGSGTLLWSYHIWHPKSDPTQTLTYVNTRTGDYNVMPMYLGAIEVVTTGGVTGTGLYYQWGRKDPLGRSAWSNNKVTVYTTNSGTGSTYTWPDAVAYNDSNACVNYNTSTNSTHTSSTKAFVKSVAYTIANPCTFITGDDWAADASNGHNFLWGNPDGNVSGSIDNQGNASASVFPDMGQTYKSIFDPSPDGYRIAPADMWLGGSMGGQANNGRLYTYATGKTDFYVASGYMSNGILIYNTTGGYSWSSSAAAAYAAHLRFDTNNVIPLHVYYRATGLTVRCVQE